MQNQYYYFDCQKLGLVGPIQQKIKLSSSKSVKNLSKLVNPYMKYLNNWLSPNEFHVATAIHFTCEPTLLISLLNNR